MLEQIAKAELLEKTKDLFDDSITYDRDWQINAQEAFGFRDGWAQWKEEEKDILEQEMRPALTLNIVKSHVDLIMGLNADQKQRYICTPVGAEDAFKCELLNNIVYWLYNKYDWESEEDSAFESALISGRGWVHIDFNLDENRLNEIKMTQTSIPVHEVRMDPAARKRDLSDCSYIFWDRWFSLEDFVIKYPDYEKKAREAFTYGAWPRYASLDGIGEMESGDMGHDINDESDYSDALDVQYYDSKRHQIRVCHMEYWKYVKKYFVWNPENGKLEPVQMKWSDFKDKYKKSYPGKQLKYEQSTVKEVWWLQFCGDEILFHGKSPIDYAGFSIVPCFMFGDVSKRRGYHYGIVEGMKDAQREINKRTSQTLNLYNQQVQPGLYAESRAFVNADQAEQSVKEAGTITWLQDGALQQKRFQERTVPAFPSAVLQMGEYAREMIRYITGVNPDLLGMNDKRQEAGIVVQLRQQQGMAILKPVFKAFSKMKMQLFERQVRIIMQHMPTKQILKILGESGRFEIDDKGNIKDTASNLVANIRDVENASYDIDGEPEDNSMTSQALELATFLEMQKNGMPVDPQVLINKTNLPVSEKVSWIEYVNKQQDAASQQAQAEMELKKMEIQGKNEIEKMKLQIQMSEIKRKADDARDKDNLKMAMEEMKLKAVKERDKQTSQIKMAQIIGQLALGKKKEQREWINMILDADLDKKRLILDTAEVLAQTRGGAREQDIKATIEMYKMAISAGNVKRQEETKMLTTIMTLLSNAAVSEQTNELDALKTTAAEQTKRLDTDKTLTSNEKIEAARLKSQEKVAKETTKQAESQAKAQVASAQATGIASVKSAKATGDASVNSAKETGKAQVASAKASAENAKKNKPL